MNDTVTYGNVSYYCYTRVNDDAYEVDEDTNSLVFSSVYMSDIMVFKYYNPSDGAYWQLNVGQLTACQRFHVTFDMFFTTTSVTPSQIQTNYGDYLKYDIYLVGLPTCKTGDYDTTPVTWTYSTCSDYACALIASEVPCTYYMGESNVTFKLRFDEEVTPAWNFENSNKQAYRIDTECYVVIVPCYAYDINTRLTFSNYSLSYYNLSNIETLFSRKLKTTYNCSSTALEYMFSDLGNMHINAYDWYLGNTDEYRVNYETRYIEAAELDISSWSSSVLGQCVTYCVDHVFALRILWAGVMVAAIAILLSHFKHSAQG